MARDRRLLVADRRRCISSCSGRTHPHDPPGCPLRAAHAPDVARVHRRRDCDARARHRREHRHLQRVESGRARSVALRAAGSPRADLGEERRAQDCAILGVGAQLLLVARRGAQLRGSGRLARRQRDADRRGRSRTRLARADHRLRVPRASRPSGDRARVRRRGRSTWRRFDRAARVPLLAIEVRGFVSRHGNDDDARRTAAHDHRRHARRRRARNERVGAARGRSVAGTARQPHDGGDGPPRARRHARPGAAGDGRGRGTPRAALSERRSRLGHRDDEFLRMDRAADAAGHGIRPVCRRRPRAVDCLLEHRGPADRAGGRTPA